MARAWYRVDSDSNVLRRGSRRIITIFVCLSVCLSFSLSALLAPVSACPIFPLLPSLRPFNTPSPPDSIAIKAPQATRTIVEGFTAALQYLTQRARKEDPFGGDWSPRPALKDGNVRVRNHACTLARDMPSSNCSYFPEKAVMLRCMDLGNPVCCVSRHPAMRPCVWARPPHSDEGVFPAVSGRCRQHGCTAHPPR